MLDGLRVSAFLAGKALQRGNKGTLVLTVMIIALVFVNLVFLPSIVAGVVVMFNQQSVDYNYGNLVVEPRENEQAIVDAGVLVRRIERIPGVLAVSPRLTAGGTVTFQGTSLARSLIGIDPTEERRVTRTSTRMIEGVYLSDAPATRTRASTRRTPSAASVSATQSRSRTRTVRSAGTW